MKLFSVLLLLALPVVASAQFTYITNSGAITITGYTGGGGAVTIPATINGYPVTIIGLSAFEDATLTSVIIPNSVTNISMKAFYICRDLTSVTIPNSVISIDEDAFLQCTLLSSVTIGSGVTTIGELAFADTGLTTITIPANVTNFDFAVFENCFDLTGAYFLGSPPYDNGYAFASDPATVYYLPGATGWGSTFGSVSTALWNPQMQTGDGSFGVQANQFGFNIDGSNGLIVVVQACTNLANPVWLPVSTNTLTSGTSYFSDPQWTNYSSRYYGLTVP